MALEALKQYAAAQNELTQQEVNKILNAPTQAPQRAQADIGNIKPLVTKESVTDALQECTRDIYKKYQENILKSGVLRTDITKGIQEGQDPYNLLLKAIECISLMTSDSLFYTMNKDNLQAIYRALGQPAALEVERQEVQERLTRLEQAYEREIESDCKSRIQNAIKRHKEKLNILDAGL